MHVSLLTYDVPHLKTQEVFYRLRRRGAFKISFTVVPFIPRPERAVAFHHRPPQMNGPSAADLAARHAIRIFRADEWQSFHRDVHHFLVCGAGLLPSEFCEAASIINCHPGLIPEARGLDAFKWAIYNGTRVGNTLHRIDGGVDLGTVLTHALTDIFACDDLATFAARHYAAEIELLAHFDEYLDGGFKLADLPIREPTKRMNIEAEREMVRRFDEYKTAHVGRPQEA